MARTTSSEALFTKGKTFCNAYEANALLEIQDGKYALKKMEEN